MKPIVLFGFVLALAGCASSLPPPTGPLQVWKKGEPIKVAVFPVISTGSGKAGDSMLQMISEELDSTPDVVVSHTWYPDIIPARQVLDDKEILDQEIVGARQVPNVPFLISKGRALGADAILIVSFRFSGPYVSISGWMTATGSGRTVELKPPDAGPPAVPGMLKSVVRVLISRTRDGD